MSCYHAEVVNLSLKNHNLLKRFLILSVKKRFLGFVKIYTISIPAENVDETVKIFQESMSTKLNKEWYITFYNAVQVIIIFRKKIFNLSGEGIIPIYRQLINTAMAKDKDKWDEMINYAKSLGIPDEQCDFVPEDFNKQKY